ncbi:MAG TPA: hypothetical protein VK906_14560 [Egicoccus sp.]|nr:hypothetical protein [Egicoccus sp.]HSK24404.1 hypothetical protein [Egicoccus sp.]
MPTTSARPRSSADQRFMRAVTLVALLVGGLTLYAILANVVGSDAPSAAGADLPNPMGGLALTAPGEVTGELELGGLEVLGSSVAMGDVALGVTYVPAWDLLNPTTGDVTVTIGQPQVLEGCCPGPVYANGELTEAGQTVVVAAGDVLNLQFPLQMHAGMDGPHHLAIPLQAGADGGAVEVTGNFTADARA